MRRQCLDDAGQSAPIAGLCRCLGAHIVECMVCAPSKVNDVHFCADRRASYCGIGSCFKRLLGDAMPAELSLSTWREQIGRRLINLDFEPSPRERFRALIEPLFHHDGLRVTRSRISAGVTFRDKSMVGDGEYTRSLLFADHGRLTVTHQGREITLRQGEATVVENWMPGRVGSDTTFAFAAVVLPVADGNSSCPGLDRVLGKPIWRNDGTLKLIRDYIRILRRKTHAHLQPGAAAAVRRHLFDLASLVVSGGNIADVDVPSVQEIRLATAIALIEGQFCDPGLTPAVVAANLNISTRYLERLLESSGRTFSARVMDLRLDAAHRMLDDPAARHLRISEIAARSGFTDLSHFSRRFRQRYGEPPSAVPRSRPK